jgi:phosphatidylglycerophosphate synthase
MSKLAVNDRFFDFSDYGRSPAVFIAEKLKNTSCTPIHVTLAFGVSGLLAVFCILNDYDILAACFLIIKSILDAADGELSRVKNAPSHAGRYLDSIFDILLNMMFLIAISITSNTGFYWTLLAFISVQLQGTLYNYYYVIIRNKRVGGDQTSKIFEYKSPNALPGEKQQVVDRLFSIFYMLYGLFDRCVHLLDRDAYKVKSFPNWFMSLVSLYGLGFQLLWMAVLLSLGFEKEIIYFFICYNILGILIIGLRKWKIK